MIVKVQLDITGTKILVYNQARTLSREFPALGNSPIAVSARKLRLKRMGKVYCHANVDRAGVVSIVGRASQQSW